MHQSQSRGSIAPSPPWRFPLSARFARDLVGKSLEGLHNPSDDAKFARQQKLSDRSPFLDLLLHPPITEADNQPISTLQTQQQSKCRATSRSVPSRSWPRPRSRTDLSPSGFVSEPVTPFVTTPSVDTGARPASASKRLVSPFLTTSHQRSGHLGFPANASTDFRLIMTALMC